MIKSFIQSLFWNRDSVQRDLARFAEIEYKKESPEYIVSLINSGQIFRN